MHLCPVITLESRSFRIKSCSRIRFAAPRSEATDFHAAFDSKSIIAFSIYVKYSHCSNVPRQFPAVQSKKLPPRMILSGSFILDCRFALLRKPRVEYLRVFNPWLSFCDTNSHYRRLSFLLDRFYAMISLLDRNWFDQVERMMNICLAPHFRS